MIVAVLPSARLRDARANLDAMVARAQDVGRSDLTPFEAMAWEMPGTSTSRVSSASSGGKTIYFTVPKAGARGLDNREELRKPFVDFLKAVVRLRTDERQTSLQDNGVMVRAGCLLHDAMERIAYDPALMLPDHLHEAAKVSAAKDAAGTAYGIGKKLVELAEWANRYAVTNVRIDFRNPNPRPRDHTGRIGREFEERRNSKMPSARALEVLPLLANQVTADADVLQMRTIELLVCGGWRINELLSIPSACEVEESATENGEPVRDAEGNPVVRYGIRYLAEKGGLSMMKWIPTPLVSVAKRAVSDIRRITEPSRETVRWMQSHPGRVNVPGLDGDPDEMVSLVDLAPYLGLHPSGGQQWAKVWGVPLLKKPRVKANFVTVGSVAEALRDRWPSMPAGWPLRLEEHLFLTPSNFLHLDRATIPGSVRFLTDGMIDRFLGGHAGLPSVFERFGYTEDDGGPILMTSHKFRHWLNTLAQRGGMSQMEIARWSGRKEEAQNSFYDHVSGVELARRVRDLVAAGDVRGPVAEVHERLPPADRTTFRETHLATAHVTELGLCIHDWSLLPCEIHGACAECVECVVVKGDGKQRGRAEELSEQTEFLLARAEEEHGDGSFGAERWVDAHRRTAAGLSRILAIHDDTSIPDGTLVQAVGWVAGGKAPEA